MKRSISLILAIAVVFCFCMVPVSAEDGAPTATLTASLVGDVPAAGEAFTVSLDLSDISTSLFKSAAVYISWPTDVASLYASDYGVTITDSSIASYAVAINKATYETTNALGITTTTDKFTDSLSHYDVEAGTGNISVTAADLSDHDPAEAENGEWNLCTVSFILGEDQSYDDFYFEITEAYAYLTEAIVGTDVCSEMVDGTLTVVGIGPTEEVVYTAVSGQVAEGVYTLPKTITSGVAEVEFDLTIASASCNTLIGFNAASNMTGTNFFSGSSVMFLANGGVLACRNGNGSGGGSNDSGFTYTVDEVYHVSVTIDMDSQTWSATITDSSDNVVHSCTDFGFRTNTDVIDSLVLVDNSGYSESLTVTNLVITVDETEEPTEAASEDEPATEEPTDEETEEPTDEETETPTEEPTDEETEEPTDEETEEPTDEETEEPTDEETEEPTEETTIPEGAIEADAGQESAVINALDEAITTTGTVEFTLVVDTDNAANTLVSVTNAELAATDYFNNAGVQFMVQGTTLSARIDGVTTEIAQIESGVEYNFVVSVDVENQTWSAVVTDAEGEEVATVDETAFRFAETASSIDSIVFLDNNYNSGAGYIYSVVVTTESTGDDNEDLSVEVTEYTYTDGGQVIAKVGLIDGATEPTDTIVYIVSFTKDGSPLGIVAGEIEVGGTINVSNTDSTGVAAISFVTGISVEDVSPVDGDSELGTPVGVYYPAE